MPPQFQAESSLTRTSLVIAGLERWAAFEAKCCSGSPDGETSWAPSNTGQSCAERLRPLPVRDISQSMLAPAQLKQSDAMALYGASSKPLVT
jgi:hypothetical protein